MKTIDVRFDDNTIAALKNIIGRNVKKYKCDPPVVDSTVYGIIGIFIDDKVYKLTNFCEVLDYYGQPEDVAVFRFALSNKDEIKTCLLEGEMIDTPIESLIKEIHVINENQRLFYKEQQTYNVWLTRGLIFILADGSEISFEKDIWFSEFIETQRGHKLISKFSSVNIFLEGWEDCEGYRTECSREATIIK
ncbi:MAG: hypothetical protein J1F01_06965 [Oscillospiraceae bacterium]|nr:hypothetical protein [Oscillospiraceae bacterium]